MPAVFATENDPCSYFEASIEAPDGLRFCPYDEDPVSFIGSATYTGDEIEYDPESFSYSWLIDDQVFYYQGGELPV